MKIGDAVLVKWKDAIADSGWTALDDVHNKPATVYTVGILTHDEPHAITVSLSAFDDQVSGWVCIPTAWIKQTKVLRKAVL